MRFFSSLLLTATTIAMVFSNASSSSAQTRRGNSTTATADTKPANTPDISYTVSMSEPYTHLLEVEMRVRATNASLPANVDLVMPVWTPGSYLVREFARHVQDFAATDPNGRTLAWRKTNKNTWRVAAAGGNANNLRELVVKYRVYANELTVRTNELNDRHAFWNNAATLMYVDGFLNAPATLRVRPFGDWKIATGLPAVENQPNTFRAPDFDVLYDSPFLVSNHRTLEFTVGGVRHRVVIDGEGNYDAERVRGDTQKIVEAATALMGDIPYRVYTFLVMLHPTAGGGLEHLNSTALIMRRFNFRPESAYKSLLALVAHEYFHLWNVKRIKPDALGPFDYTRENYTRLLWVAEGFTSYYENLLLRRAGLMTDREFLDEAAKTIKTIQNVPGRRRLSLEEASFDAWIKYYRQDENAINSQVSYYDKGGLVGMLLDLEIRRRANGTRSLDDVMRTLYTDFAKRNRNYTPEDFQQVAERVAGGKLDEFFARYVRGTEELPYDQLLASVGLRLDTTGGKDSAAPRAYLGANLVEENNRLIIRNVLDETPAYNQGLNANDQIVALDGARATLATFNTRLEERKPGDEVTLTVFRNDDLRTIRIKLGATAEGDYRILPVPNPTDAQRRLYTGWLGTELKQVMSTE